MPLSKQIDHTLRPIDDHRKKIRDVTIKHAHVKDSGVPDRGILPSEHDFAIILTRQPNSSLENDGTDYSSHPPKPFLSHNGLEVECP